MVGTRIDIKRLNLDELLGVVSIYPWYAGARKELCSRMAASGTLSRQQRSQAALYIRSRRILHSLVRSNVASDYTDTEIRKQVKKVIEAPRVPDPGRIFVVGGDYFSTAQYKEVRREDDAIFSRFATSEREDVPMDQPEETFDFCTETLAEIYAEQGYLDEAKEIYSKLSLRYPEKSIYFASLIEKLDKN